MCVCVCVCVYIYIFFFSNLLIRSLKWKLPEKKKKLTVGVTDLQILFLALKGPQG